MFLDASESENVKRTVETGEGAAVCAPHAWWDLQQPHPPHKFVPGTHRILITIRKPNKGDNFVFYVLKRFNVNKGSWILLSGIQVGFYVFNKAAHFDWTDKEA